MTTVADTPAWMGKSHGAPSLDEELQTIKNSGGRENCFTPEMSTLLGYTIPSGQP